MSHEPNASTPTSPAAPAGEDAPRRRLGLGLNALLGGTGPTATADGTPGAAAAAAADDGEAADLKHVAIGSVQASPHQARRDFNADELAELTGSVREHGILQPLLVREIDGGFQLVAGERRLKAARKAGLDSVPVRIVDVVDQTAYEYALEENLKRSDLNDLEKARAFRAYIDQFKVTVRELAKQISMSTPGVSNIMRLLDLPESAQTALAEGRISGGHARAVLMVKDDAGRLELCGRIQAEKLTVRQAETEARGFNERAEAEAPTLKLADAKKQAKKPSKHEQFLTPHIKQMEQRVRDRMGVKTEIRLNAKEKGKVTLTFSSAEEFEALMAKLSGDEEQTKLKIAA